MYENTDFQGNFELNDCGIFALIVITLAAIAAITWLVYEARQRRENDQLRQVEVYNRLDDARKVAISSQAELLAFYRSKDEQSTAEVKRLTTELSELKDQQAADSKRDGGDNPDGKTLQ